LDLNVQKNTNGAFGCFDFIVHPPDFVDL
jgi:hypothetical protein